MASAVLTQISNMIPWSATMKLIKLSAIAMTGCLALAAIAPAQARDHDHDRGRDRRGPDRVIVIRDDHRGPHDRRDWDGRRNDRADHWRHGPGPRWSRGDRLPPSYRGRNYVVNDWRGHRLAPPPRGAHWVGVGADYLLVGIATGVIMQAVLSR
jgi:Ni/Co efflux regulator RcnB